MIKIIAAAALAVAAVAPVAAAGPSRPATGDAAALNAEVLRTRRVGPATVNLGRAVLDLPPGRMFVPRPAATRILAAMGRTADGRLIGLVFPIDGATGWVVVATAPPAASCTTDAAACVRLSLLSEVAAPNAPAPEIDDLLARIAVDSARPETGFQAFADDDDDGLAAFAASVDPGGLGLLALAGLGGALPMLFKRRAEAAPPAG